MTELTSVARLPLARRWGGIRRRGGVGAALCVLSGVHSRSPVPATPVRSVLDRQWGLAIAVSPSASHGARPFDLVVTNSLPDDDDASSARELHAEQGPTERVRDSRVHAFARLNPEELADVVAHRMRIERAVGVLMAAYDLDTDNAVELLTWGARALDITAYLLARRLTEHLVGCDRNDHQGQASCESVDLRSACDDVLFTAHER